MPHPPRAETILVVDNDLIIRDLIATMLNHQGYTVLEACNGEEALATAAQYPDPIHLLARRSVRRRTPGNEGAIYYRALRP